MVQEPESGAGLARRRPGRSRLHAEYIDVVVGMPPWTVSRRWAGSKLGEATKDDGHRHQEHEDHEELERIGGSDPQHDGHGQRPAAASMMAAGGPMVAVR